MFLSVYPVILQRITLICALISLNSLRALPATLNISINGQDVSGKTIVIEGKSSDESIKSYMVIRNSSGSAILVKVRKSEIKTVFGSLNSFCLGECYPPLVTESPNPLNLPANSSTAKELFYAEYYPNGQSGITEIRYEVFDVSNSANSAWVVIIFDARQVTGVIEFPDPSHRITVFPNPVSAGQFTVSIPEWTKRAPVRLTLSGTGGIMHAFFIPDVLENKIIIPTTGLTDGIYFITLSSDSKLIYREKLVILRTGNR